MGGFSQQSLDNLKAITNSLKITEAKAKTDWTLSYQDSKNYRHNFYYALTITTQSVDMEIASFCLREISDIQR